MSESTSTPTTIYTDLSHFCDIDDSKELKIDKVTTIATNIWRFIIDHNLKNKRTDNYEIKLLEDIQIEYTHFSQLFPLVLRWMVQMKQFKVKVYFFFITLILLHRTSCCEFCLFIFYYCFFYN